MGDYEEDIIGWKCETTNDGIYTCCHFTKNIIKIRKKV